MNLSTVKSAVTISLVPEAKGGPFVFWGDLAGSFRTAATLGYDAVELFVPSADAIPVQTGRDLIASCGIRISTIGTGAGWVLHKLSLTDGDVAVRQRAIAFVKSIIERAAAFGAPAIIGSIQGRSGNGVSRDQALDHLAAALNELGDFAATFGQTLIYEPLNRYETDLINSVDEALPFLAGLRTPQVRLLPDLFHMNIEEGDIADSLRRAGRHIGHLHFVDSNRRPPGCGHIDYAPIVKALSDIGYAGYAAAEARPWPDSDTAAALNLDTFHKLFR